MTQDEQDELAKTIKTLVEKADQGKQKADQFYIAAGLHLITLKARTQGHLGSMGGAGQEEMRTRQVAGI